MEGDFCLYKMIFDNIWTHFFIFLGGRKLSQKSNGWMLRNILQGPGQPSNKDDPT